MQALRSFALCIAGIGTAALLMGASPEGERMLHDLEPYDIMRIACGCSFKESIPGAKEGSYGSGPELLVIDINGEPAHIRVNPGDGNARLLPSSKLEFPLYECNVNEKWTTRWQKDDLEVEVRLVAEVPGAEACWFHGEIAAKRGAKTWSAPLKGACGC
jgi:hypothetical protein